jgi:hypothetical protein
LVIDRGALYVGGLFTNAGNVPALNVARWDGINWSALGSGIPFLVTSMASDGSNVYVGGAFTNAGGVIATNIARWDGQRWWPLGNGVKGREFGLGTVDTIAVGADGIYVGGSFTNASGVNATNIARWDGTNWHELHGGILPRVRTIAVVGTRVYAGTDEFSVDGTNLVSLSEWNGSGWRPIAVTRSPAAAGATALAACGNALYLGGGFPSLDGLRVAAVARWDGQRWEALGSGFTQGGPGAFVCTGTELFVGGQFTHAGGRPSTNIALWHIPHTLTVNRTAIGTEVKWPATGTNFLLETRSGDLGSMEWSPVSEPVTIRDGECVVTDPLDATTRFYRLRRKPWE